MPSDSGKKSGSGWILWAILGIVSLILLKQFQDEKTFNTDVGGELADLNQLLADQNNGGSGQSVGGAIGSAINSIAGIFGI
jgi:hypothetical protein